jgi:O-antigen ligase
MQASSASSSADPLSHGERRSRRRSWTLERADEWCERGILILVTGLLVFMPLAFGGWGVPQVLVMQGVTIGVLVLWTVRAWLSKSYRLFWAPICWAVLLFMGYALVRYRMVLAANGVEYLARQEVLLVLMYGFLFFAILNNLSRQESTQVISIALISVATIISLYALYQFLTKSAHVLWSPQHPGYFGRASGTYVCPNHLAGLLEMILPLALAFTLTGRFKPTAKVFLGYASVAICTGIGVSISRGAWVATGIGLLVLFGLLIRQRGLRLAAVVFGVLLVGAFFFFVKNLSVLQRRIGVVTNEHRLDIVRLQLWRPAYRMWQDHLWWGVGPAHFDVRFRQYRPDDIQMRPQYTHNDYLNTLADWGLVGGAIVASAFGLLFLGVYQSWKFVQRSNDLTTKRSNRSAFVLGGAAGLVAILAHSFVDFNMHIPANALVAVTLMALITGHLRFASERFWFRVGWVGKPVLTLCCLSGALYLAAQGVGRAHEYVLLERAERAKAPGDTTAMLKAAEVLKEAHVVEPSNFETIYNIGEYFWLVSWEGVGNYRELATEAIRWFELGAKVNQFDPYSYMRWGMCQHWLDRPEQAGKYFEKALELDPKNYYIQGHVGWHYFQLGKWDESEHWFKKAIYGANWHPEAASKRYETGYTYLKLIDRKRQEEKAARN